MGVDLDGVAGELLPNLGDVVVGVVVAFEIPFAWCELDEVVGAKDAQDVAVGVSDDTFVPGTVFLLLLDQSVCDCVHALGGDAFDCELVVGLVDEIHCNRYANEVNISDVSEQLRIVICHLAEAPLGGVVGWVGTSITDRRLNQCGTRIDIEVQLVLDGEPYTSHDGFGYRDADCWAAGSVQGDGNGSRDRGIDISGG